jgi:hypothetical protein
MIFLIFVNVALYTEELFVGGGGTNFVSFHHPNMIKAFVQKERK